MWQDRERLREVTYTLQIDVFSVAISNMFFRIIYQRRWASVLLGEDPTADNEGSGGDTAAAAAATRTAAAAQDPQQLDSKRGVSCWRDLNSCIPPSLTL